uniref:Uncharacterized protein n=1 Tax=Anopheles dirus TaxID=7168 RepID=A0A182NXJ4_9DIPT
MFFFSLFTFSINTSEYDCTFSDYVPERMGRYSFQLSWAVFCFVFFLCWWLCSKGCIQLRTGNRFHFILFIFFSLHSTL